MRDNKNSKMTIIKGITISFLFAGSTVVLAKDDCADLTGCAKKACEVNHQLLTAKRQGNSHQAAGLNKALNNINEYCTQDGLKAELQQKIDDTNSEIEEYKTDLKKAKRQGKHDKVEKYQQKLNDETKQLKQLIDELNSLVD
jgi:predicted translin family RNA/ssDNA-binding protein